MIYIEIPKTGKLNACFDNKVGKSRIGETVIFPNFVIHVTGFYPVTSTSCHLANYRKPGRFPVKFLCYPKQLKICVLFDVVVVVGCCVLFTLLPDFTFSKLKIALLFSTVVVEFELFICGLF